MSLLWVLFIILIVWLVFKIGLQALKWGLVLAVVVFAFWFLTAGGVKFEKPSGMPDLPSFPTLTK